MVRFRWARVGVATLTLVTVSAVIGREQWVVTCRGGDRHSCLHL